MRRLLQTGLALIAATLLVLGAPALPGRPKPANAHPLGNFTVNRYVRVALTSESIRLRYVIDMAEIPAFQEIKGIDRNGDGLYTDDETSPYLAPKVRELLRGIDLRVGGRAVALQPVGQTITFPAGQGGLSTLRLVFDATAPAVDGWRQGVDASLRDSNYADRLGWKEIVIQAGEGVKLLETSAPSQDTSAELTAYPEDRLKSPLDIREARFRFAPGDGANAAAPLTVAPAAGKRTGRSLDRFARLVAAERLTPAFVALSLLAAAAWGAAHAIGPGHGKTIVAAYLVGSRGTARHALLLGLTVTATHTSSVIALGLATLYASRYFATEDLYLWLSVASGLLVVAMGAILFATRLRAALGDRRSSPPEAVQDHAPDHVHPHEHGHNHSHAHLPAGPGWRSLVALGISGGILPCPTALVVMLGAIALDRVGFGLILVLAFSVGLAAVLTGIGLVLVYANRLVSGPGRLGTIMGSALLRRWLQTVPIASALIILAVGLVLTGRALSGVL